MTKKTNSKTNTVKEKKKLSKSGLMLIIGLVIILIPCLVFGGILLSSAMGTSTPQNGKRFDGDLEPAISSSQLSSLESTIKSLGNVESAEVVLKTAQVRVNVNAKDTASNSEIAKLVDDSYAAVNSALPVSTYFTASGSKKMYDLQINVYNVPTNDTGSQIYYILVKNSTMAEPETQLVSEPLNPELVKDLYGESEPEVVEPVEGEQTGENE